MAGSGGQGRHGSLGRGGFLVPLSLWKMAVGCQIDDLFGSSYQDPAESMDRYYVMNPVREQDFSTYLSKSRMVAKICIFEFHVCMCVLWDHHLPTAGDVSTTE